MCVWLIRFCKSLFGGTTSEDAEARGPRGTIRASIELTQNFDRLFGDDGKLVSKIKTEETVNKKEQESEERMSLCFTDTGNPDSDRSGHAKRVQRHGFATQDAEKGQAMAQPPIQKNDCLAATDSAEETKLSVKLTRTDGKDFGVKYGVGLLVTSIQAESAAADWNASNSANPARMIREGDKVIAVNGLTTNADMLKLLRSKNDEEIEIVFLRGGVKSSQGLKSSLAKGKGDLDVVMLKHTSGSSAEIYLLGATLCSYKTSSGKEHIFVSPGAVWDGIKAIRGGVPLVFPQFGQPNTSMPQHGFARTSIWSVKDITDTSSESNVILTLSDSSSTREKWPHAFNLEYAVSLTATRLRLALRITNSGDAPFKFHALLHTYFQIPNIGDAVVRGLQGRNYIDKVAGGETIEEKNSDIVLPSFTDRIYISTMAEPTNVSIAQKGGTVMFEIKNETRIADVVRPCDVVVWNPYEQASPGDLPPPAFKQFVCVEPGMVSQLQDLAPKTSAELSQEILAV